jgi:hypothetical protein
MDLADIEPKNLPVPVIVRFPDNRPRDIEGVIYEVNGKVVDKLPPTQSFVLDLTKLPKGENDLTLLVKVMDILGIEGVSDPVRIKVIVDKPERPENGVISGLVPGGNGDQLMLVDEAGQVVASTTVGEDDSYQFVNLPEGNYLIKDVTRQQGVTEIGPVSVDGQALVTIPEGEGFPPPPMVIMDESVTRNPLFWISWICLKIVSNS